MTSLEVLSRAGSVDILEFLDLGKQRFTDLYRAVDNPRTLSSRLAELTELGLIKHTGKFYCITERGSTALSLLRELELTVTIPQKHWFRFDSLEKIPLKVYREYLRCYSQFLYGRYKDRLVSVVVFGSVPRGEAKIGESDIDVLIVVEGWRGKLWDRLAELAEVEEELGKTSIYSMLVKKGIWPIVQNYPLSTEEAEEFNRIYLDMVFERAILYDKENFMENVLERLRRRLVELGSQRIQLPNGSWYWVLKPDLKAGEEFKI